MREAASLLHGRLSTWSSSALVGASPLQPWGHIKLESALSLIDKRRKGRNQGGSSLHPQARSNAASIARRVEGQNEAGSWIRRLSPVLMTPAVELPSHALLGGMGSSVVRGDEEEEISERRHEEDKERANELLRELEELIK